MKCPFVYADGHRCTGNVYAVRAYGKNDYGIVQREDIRKIRLWCSAKEDHAGAVRNPSTKERMEFYPDELERRGIYEQALDLCNNVPVPEKDAA